MPAVSNEIEVQDIGQKVAAKPDAVDTEDIPPPGNPIPDTPPEFSDPSLFIGAPPIPSGIAGDPYPVTMLQAFGGEAPFTWTILTGSLPAGVDLNGSTGETLFCEDFNFVSTLEGVVTFVVQDH